MARKISKSGELTPSTKTTVFTVPVKNTALWHLLFLSNHTGNNKWVSAWWYDASTDTEIRIIDSTNVDAKKTLQFGGNVNEYVVLEENDEIRLQAENGSEFTYIVSMEIYPNQSVQFTGG
jgi:hypothetical protein